MKGRHPMFLVLALVAAVVIGLGLAAKADIFEFTWWSWLLAMAGIFGVAFLYDHVERRRGRRDK